MGNPHTPLHFLVISMVDVEKDFNRLWNKEKARLKAAGVPPQLIEKARKFAWDYMYGIVDKFFSELPPEKRKILYDDMINDAVVIAGKWAKGLMKLSEVI